MSIRTNELQQIIAPQSEDSILLESAAAGTGQLTMARAAEFFDQELLKPGTQLSTSLSQKAGLSAQQTVELASVPSRTVEVAASELPGYIASLPRLLTERLTITVSSGTFSVVSIKYFYGPGALTIQAAEGAVANCASKIDIQNCAVPVTISGIKFPPGSPAGEVVRVTGTHVIAQNCVIDRYTETPANTKAGYLIEHGGSLVLRNCEIKNCREAIIAQSNGIISAWDCTGSANNVGIDVATGGIAMLAGTTPDLMGGSTNEKHGGLIVKSDGTLL